MKRRTIERDGPNLNAAASGKRYEKPFTRILKYIPQKVTQELSDEGGGIKKFLRVSLLQRIVSNKIVSNSRIFLS